MIGSLKPYPQYKNSSVPWVGDVPEHWDVRRIKTIARLLVSNVDKHTLDGERAVRLCNYVDVYKNDRVTSNLRYMRASAAPKEIERFRPSLGDVIITKDSEMWNDIAVPAIVEYEAPDFLCGYHLAILRAHPHTLTGAFLFWSIQSPGVATQFQVAANGVTRFGLSHHAVGGVRIPLPMPGEQSAIVRFLDQADRRIRRYVTAKKKLIGLLNEQKQAIIDRAVTRGLDPSVRLKPSAIDWLGEVPEHWEITRIKNLVREVDFRSTTGTETLLSMRMHHGLVPFAEHYSRPPQSVSLIGFKKVSPGQLVVNRMQAGNGLIFASHLMGLVSPDYAVFDPVGDVNIEFLAELFRSRLARAKFRAESKGLGTGTSGFLRLYSDRLGVIHIALPSRPQQDAILAWLLDELYKVEASKAVVEREITLIREYRTRIIADVVTGKLDVREAAANLPDEVDEGEAALALEDVDAPAEEDDALESEIEEALT